MGNTILRKKKKEFQSLNEKYKNNFTTYSSLTMAQWSVQQYKRLS